MTAVSAKPPIRWLNLAVLGIPPLIALTVVPWYGFTQGYDAFEWVWFFILLTFCEMSITAGYHRLWSHKAYKAHPALRVLYALGGAMALQNDAITWAADHRRHHLYVDDNEKDPYSANRGFWYSHFEWMIRDWPSTRQDTDNVADLYKDPILRWQRKHYLALLLLMNLGVPLALGWYNGDVWGGLLLLGFLRLTLSQHFTYLINSAAHMWGKRPYSPEQTARDNWLIALLTYGEGFHNYHHTFAFDYRNGIKWFHWDPTKWWIKACSWLGLASGLRACSPYRLEKTRVEVQYQHALAKCEQLRDTRWRAQLEAEYQQLSNTLNHWNELRQQWLEAKSKALSKEFHDKSKELHEKLNELDLPHLKARYQELRRQLRLQRKSWQDLQTRFALHYAGAGTA